MEGVEECAGIDALPSRCLNQCWEDAVGLDAIFRSGAETDLSHNHDLPQGLLGMIIRGWHSGDALEGEEMFLIQSDEKRSQGLGGLERKRVAPDLVQFLHEPFFTTRRLFPGKFF